MKQFPSSPDRLAVLLPYIFVIFTIVLVTTGIIGSDTSAYRPVLMLAVMLGPLILLSVTILMYYLRPLSITVENDSISVERKLYPVTIPISEIRAIREVSENDMKFTIRLFGASGVWCYIGKYYNRKLGRMTWYCTQRQHYILIEKTNKEKVIISPDQPEEFLKEIRLLAPALITTQTTS